MPRRVHEEDLRAIEVAVRQHPDGLTAQQIADALQSAPPRRTLQYRLKSLVTSKRLVMEGTGRWARYRAPRAISMTADFVGRPATMSATLDVLPALSEPAVEILEHVRQPTVSRTPVGYDREFLDSYRPNETFYLSESERALLQNIGRPTTAQHQPAGTYAKRLLDRLLLVVVEVDPVLKKRLHAALTLDGITLKDWFRQQAKAYLTGHQGLAQEPAIEETVSRRRRRKGVK